MSTRLQFSQNFSHQMAILATIIGMAISLMTPVTYGIMAWRDFNEIAVRHTEDIARKVGRSAMDDPDLWYYNITKFIEFINATNYQHEIKSIKSYDKNLNLKFEHVLNEKVSLTYAFQTPVKYGNEIYGYIEIEQNIQPLLITITVLLFFFTFLGLSIGILLYRFPVNIVKLAEKDVQSHADQTKRQTDLEVARLDRLSLVGQMAAAIGHEIRNPLTTVKGYLQFLSQKTVFAPFASQFNLMLDELSRANSIIAEFLSLSHEKAINMTLCSLNQIIEAFQPLLESDALLHGMKLDIDLKSIPNLLLDEKEIKQLILNLTRNGFEAMQYGGCLSIRSYTLDNYVVLSIIDQGKGIDPNLITKLGTPFFTTKDTGTGLGLAVCYSIAHRHKAKIDFVTSKDGTTFSIFFPQIV
ncbi:ATP-binding protein [Pelosinus sp. UFO1]|uniref:ATP-binding protein n=1 Tax=Pelosinus sp. UFO1 TaxID=484770 RepID=UPI0004D14457|nr:ATP-binding protein [Pelosinus sp. UFO1]AIF52269.1 integral membrane sensor signal transduction histidine kinase [Pelosinus sp. UFO1]